ncbi:MAG: CoA-transferase subunit beta [Planctomycetota bacterium]|jgi:glutaconate CoA-transferase subunit B
MPEANYTADEMMVVAASRLLTDGAVVFIGIGLPSLTANLARRLHAPNLVMIYESGTMDTTPDRPPLSIGDDELSRKARCIVSVPEMFRYWLQGGKTEVGFLGAAQVDRHCNINTTVIGDYENPKVRFPGAGGAPEIASFCGHTMIMLRQSLRTFVPQLHFVTSVGYGDGPGYREQLGFTGKGPRTVITDLGILEPCPETYELVLTHLHPGVELEQVTEATGWPLKIADDVKRTREPKEEELSILRALKAAQKNGA